jgi:hypothetical protein
MRWRYKVWTFHGKFIILDASAEVAELADALDSGSSGE